MNQIEKIEARIAELKILLAHEADQLESIQYADGQAYYEERRRFVTVREELFSLQGKLRSLTIHTCTMPEHIATQRAREKMEAGRKARIAKAIEQMESLFGSKK